MLSVLTIIQLISAVAQSSPDSTWIAVVSSIIAIISVVVTGLLALAQRRTDSNASLALSDRQQNRAAFDNLSKDLDTMQTKYDSLSAKFEAVAADNAKLLAQVAVANLQREQWQHEREQWQKERESWQKEREEWAKERAILLIEIDILKGNLEMYRRESNASNGRSTQQG